VGIEGGVSGNVVPDEVNITVGHRFAPDRSIAEAEAWVREWLEPFVEPGDEVELVDAAPGAWPATDHPLISAAIDRHGLAVSAKLGWTDVARFAGIGIPAVNLGPGDPLLAHTADERLDRAALERTWRIVRDVLTER